MKRAYARRGTGICARGHQRPVGGGKSCPSCNNERKFWKRNHALYLAVVALADQHGLDQLYATADLKEN